MKKHQIVLVFVIMFGILNLATGQCPRDEAAALAEDSTWACRKECATTADCGGLKSCNCDGHCGMSCFNPDAECPEITVDDGSIVLSNERKYGSKATVTCTPGYALTGQRVRNCRSDREWSHSNNVPNCTQGCRLPSSDLGNAFPASGTDYYAVGYPVGHVVTYTCRTGYIGAGNGDRTCLNSFTWSNLQMACTIRSCGSPETVTHASHSGTNYNFGGWITYSCDKGYNIDGTARFSCRITDDVAEWYPEGSWPTCDPVRCIAPQTLDNGGYTGAYTQEYGDGVDYYCDPGYNLNGTEKLQCNENGTWGDMPTCDPSPDATFNLVELDGYTVVPGSSWKRTRVTDYRGLAGYSLEGDGTVRSVPYPLTGGEMVCVQAYIKNTQANELKAQAYQGGETKDLHTFSASDDWKLEKFWFTPVKSTDTLVQLQFFATVGSNVLLDEIKEVNDSECVPYDYCLIPCTLNSQCIRGQDGMMTCVCDVGYSGNGSFCDAFVTTPMTSSHPSTASTTMTSSHPSTASTTMTSSLATTASASTVMSSPSSTSSPSAVVTSSSPTSSKDTIATSLSPSTLSQPAVVTSSSPTLSQGAIVTSSTSTSSSTERVEPAALPIQPTDGNAVITRDERINESDGEDEDGMEAVVPPSQASSQSPQNTGFDVLEGGGMEDVAPVQPSSQSPQNAGFDVFEGADKGMQDVAPIQANSIYPVISPGEGIDVLEGRDEGGLEAVIAPSRASSIDPVISPGGRFDSSEGDKELDMAAVPIQQSNIKPALTQNARFYGSEGGDEGGIDAFAPSPSSSVNPEISQGGGFYGSDEGGIEAVAPSQAGSRYPIISQGGGIGGSERGGEDGMAAVVPIQQSNIKPALTQNARFFAFEDVDEEDVKTVAPIQASSRNPKISRGGRIGGSEGGDGVPRASAETTAPTPGGGSRRLRLSSSLALATMLALFILY